MASRPRRRRPATGDEEAATPGGKGRKEVPPPGLRPLRRNAPVAVGVTIWQDWTQVSVKRLLGVADPVDILALCLL